MPRLHALNSHLRQGQNRSNIQLTAVTTPVISGVLIKAGMYADFANLVADAARTPDLLATIKPSQVGKAARNLSDQGDWGAFVQLVCAIQTEPRLLASIQPSMVQGASAYLLSPDEPGHAKAYNLNGISDFSEMVKAVSSRKNLRAVISAEDVAAIAHTLAGHFSQTYSRGQPQTVYYQDKLDTFITLLDGIQDDQRLNTLIEATDIAKAVETYWSMAVEKTNEYATDQGYPTDVPKDFKGFDPLAAFMDRVAGAPEAWRLAVADKVSALASAGMSSRTGPFTSRIIAQHEWLMDADRFTRVFNAQPNTSCMSSMLYQFAAVERMRPAYPAAIRSYMAAGMHSTGELHIHSDIVEALGGEVVAAARELVAKLADDCDYAALSRVMQNRQDDSVMRAMQEELSARGLHSYVMTGYDRDDTALNAVMGHRRTLDIVFRKASGDAIVCADPVDEDRGYTHTKRLPRDVVKPADTLAAMDAVAPEDVIPIMRLGFERAAAGQIAAPEWVREIARKMLAAAPAP